MHGPEPSPASTRPFSGPRGAEQAELRNALYAKEWSRFRGFFCPAMKPLRTAEAGSRKKRVSDKPLTPFERLKILRAGRCGRDRERENGPFPVALRAPSSGPFSRETPALPSVIS